jgi:large subunit ribosomal protein L31
MNTMKANIHPRWYPQAKVTCVCGNEFTTGATVPELQVEVCAACHPFYTGKMKFVDTKGRVQKFQDKQRKAKAAKAGSRKKSKSKRKKTTAQQPSASLKEMLAKAKKG